MGDLGGWEFKIRDGSWRRIFQEHLFQMISYSRNCLIRKGVNFIRFKDAHKFESR